MNKKVIAAGAASAVLAALPMVGVFAEGISRTDTLTVTVEKGCSFEATASEGINETRILGQGMTTGEIEGVTFTTACNDTNTGTWELKAIGENSAKMTGTSGDISSTSGTLDGTASNWAFRIDVSGDAIADGSYGNWSQIPDTATKVAGNSSTAATGSGTVKAVYGVSAGSDLTAGTYTGHVIYTLTNVPA